MKQNTAYDYSIIDNNHPVSKDNWVVSIVRKSASTAKKNNEEHAFLIVEGKNSEGKVVLKRYELLINENSRNNDSLIKIKEKTVDEEEAKMVFLDEFIKRDDWYAITWNIVIEQAEALQEMAEKDRRVPPKYNISGIQATGPAFFCSSSSSQAGHNCFTWAREKLLALQDERIQIPINFTDKLWARTSNYITGNNTNSWCVLL